jgi:hypothetical protein
MSLLRASPRHEDESGLPDDITKAVLILLRTGVKGAIGGTPFPRCLPLGALDAAVLTRIRSGMRDHQERRAQVQR